MPKKEKKLATLRLANQQDEVRLPVRKLLKQLKASLPFLPRALPEELTDIQIVLVTRKTICEVHDRFLQDPTETDVITFPYGEILVCPWVAVRQAPLHQLTVAEEVLLYGLHGLLHLAGYDDKEPKAADEMEHAQLALLDKCRAIR